MCKEANETGAPPFGLSKTLGHVLSANRLRQKGGVPERKYDHPRVGTGAPFYEAGSVKSKGVRSA